MADQPMAGHYSSGPRHETDRHLLDRLDRPDDLRAEHHSFPMLAANAPKAPPTEQDEGVDPSDQAEPNGRSRWSRRSRRSRPRRSSHRCG
jgi:hypothetical protein